MMTDSTNKNRILFEIMQRGIFLNGGCTKCFSGGVAKAVEDIVLLHGTAVGSLASDPSRMEFLEGVIDDTASWANNP